ncbi:MAG: hypothetical protein H6R10_713 [Rhodocyclaceae bacterium]|nr:hypothetical protein [Rhodocyclaceae bacterium]
MKPIRIEFDLGCNCHRQPVKLVHEKGLDGRFAWAIHRLEANQRDDHAVIGGLGDDQILAMADAVKASRHERRD